MEKVVLSSLVKFFVIGSMTRLDVRYNWLGAEGESLLRRTVEGRSEFELLL